MLRAWFLSLASLNPFPDYMTIFDANVCNGYAKEHQPAHELLVQHELSASLGGEHPPVPILASRLQARPD
jgi:hypothetical protein